MVERRCLLEDNWHNGLSIRDHDLEPTPFHHADLQIRLVRGAEDHPVHGERSRIHNLTRDPLKQRGDLHYRDVLRLLRVCAGTSVGFRGTRGGGAEEEREL